MRNWLCKKLAENPRCLADADAALSLALHLEGLSYAHNTSYQQYQSAITGFAMQIARDTKRGVAFQPQDLQKPSAST